jgi:hypothetical protein
MSDVVITTGSGHGVRPWPWLAAFAQPCDVFHPFLRSRPLLLTLDLSAPAFIFDTELIFVVVVPSRLV